MNWTWAVSLGAGIIFGVIGFFLKRTISVGDETARRVDKIDQGKVSREELKEMKQGLETSIKKLSGDIEGIKENYITKEDFYREQSKTERKLDMIIDLLLKRKKADG